jgi:pimeloyl-ACP methyl ester carboxylesterase
MPIINANGCDFYYERQGKGRDMVIIHGEIHGLEYWEHQFSEFSVDHRCFAYNRRGHARTGWTDYGFSLVNQTRDLEQLITRLDIERPVIVAVAFGTTIAANYAIQNPSKLRGLVLGAWSEMHDALQYFERWERYTAQAASVLEREGRDALIALLREHGGKSIYRVIPVDSPVREKVIQMFASHPLGEYQRGMLEFGCLCRIWFRNSASSIFRCSAFAATRTPIRTSRRCCVACRGSMRRHGSQAGAASCIGKSPSNSTRRSGRFCNRSNRLQRDWSMIPKACPGLDPGWIPVFGNDHAPAEI